MSKYRESPKSVHTLISKSFQAEQLMQVKAPLSVTTCEDICCKDEFHRDDLNIFSVELLETLQEVAEENLAKSSPQSNKGRKKVPGWKEDVKPFRDMASGLGFYGTSTEF